MANYQTRMRDLREDNDLKQETVAKYLGVTQTYYSRYELGKVPLPLEKFIALCKFYNVSADYLLGFSNTPKPLNKK